jgi:hypothetical protein
VPAQVPSLVIATYGFASVIPAGAILLALSGGALVPEPRALLFIAAALTIGVFAYYGIIAALRMGEIAVVTPFRYSRLLFAVAIGMIFFGERPDASTFLGAGARHRLGALHAPARGAARPRSENPFAAGPRPLRKAQRRLRHGNPTHERHHRHHRPRDPRQPGQPDRRGGRDPRGRHDGPRRGALGRLDRRARGGGAARRRQGRRYGGKGVLQAVAAVNGEIAEALSARRDRAGDPSTPR